MGRVNLFTLIKDTFSYTSKDSFGKQIPSKEIPSRTGEPVKEIKNILEDENDKQLRMSTGGPLKNKEMIRDGNDNRVHMIKGGTLKKKEMLR